MKQLLFYIVLSLLSLNCGAQEHKNYTNRQNALDLLKLKPIKPKLLPTDEYYDQTPVEFKSIKNRSSLNATLQGDYNTVLEQYNIQSVLIGLEYKNDSYMPLVNSLPGLPNMSSPTVPNNEYSDAYRTTSARLRLGGLTLGMKLYTDEPIRNSRGFYDAIRVDPLDNTSQFVYNEGQRNTPIDPRSRNGILYFQTLPWSPKIGVDTDGIRHFFQNGLHDIFGVPWFERINYPGRFYFQY